MNLQKRAQIIGVGTIVAQLISAVGLILIPKLYSPSEFGLYIIVLTTATFIQPFATLRIEILSTVVKKQEDSNLLFWFVKRLTAVVSGLAFIFILVFSVTFTARGANASVGFSLAVSIIILVQSFTIIFIQERLRSGDLKRVALSGVLQNGTTLIFQVILSGVRHGGLTLFLGYVLGRIVSIFSLQVPPDLRRKSKYSIRNIKEYNLGTLLRPVGKIFPAGIFDAVNLAMPILFIGVMFGTGGAGIIGLLQSALLVPVTLVGSMTFSAIYSQSEVVQELGFIKMYERYRTELGQQMFRVNILLFGLSIFFAGVVLPKFLDNSWSVDFRLAVVMSAAFSLQLQTYSTIGILNALEKFNIPRNFAVIKSSAGILLCFVFTFIKIEAAEFAIIFYSINLLSNLGFLLFAQFKLKRD